MAEGLKLERMKSGVEGWWTICSCRCGTLGTRRLGTNGGSCGLGGQAVEADCRVRGNGAPCLRWRKQDQQEATVGVADGVDGGEKRRPMLTTRKCRKGYFRKSKGVKHSTRQCARGRGRPVQVHRSQVLWRSAKGANGANWPNKARDFTGHSRRRIIAGGSGQGRRGKGWRDGCTRSTGKYLTTSSKQSCGFNAGSSILHEAILVTAPYVLAYNYWVSTSVLSTASV